MIIDTWFATLGVVAYAVWAALGVLVAGLAIAAHQASRRAMWLAVLVAAIVMATRFALLALAIGPVTLLDRRQTQIVAWGLDMIGAIAAVVAVVLYLRYLYRLSPPRRGRERRHVDNFATGME